MRRQRSSPTVEHSELISLSGIPNLAIDVQEAALALHALEEYSLLKGCGGIGPETIGLKQKLRQYLFPKEIAGTENGRH